MPSSSDQEQERRLVRALFERLVLPSNILAQPFPSITIRRMRPSIANLVRKTIYPDLQDGGSVANYPAVTGMKHKLF